MDHSDRRKPSESNFSVKEGEDGLSVNWNKYSTPISSLIRVGKTYKHGKTQFKNPNDFYVYKLKVEYVRSIKKIKEIQHNPLFYATPPIIGKPNNKAHTLVKWEYIDDLEIRVKLRDHAKLIHIRYKIFDNSKVSRIALWFYSFYTGLLRK
ncbi:MAG: hypothetical protein JO149_07850 [Gammaproteobacteria bacterium]|nr:hypothetical protein [Gammaproteobacteria bacterium]